LKKLYLPVLAAFALSTGSPATAQDISRPAVTNWRPKEGVYAVPGPNFDNACMDRDEAFIELSDNLIGGEEYGCKINRLHDLASGTIKFDVGDDASAGKSSKETILLTRVDDNTVFWRQTDGKVKDPGMTFSYCPEEAQRLRREAKARDKAEAERKAAEERMKHKLWRPKDGVYASPGKDFNRQCGEYGDVTIKLTEKRVSGNEWGCDVTKLSDTAPGSIKLDMTCDDYNLAEFLNDPDWENRKFNEIMLLKRINEKTIFIRKTLNGKFVNAGWRASYCPEELQRFYREQAAKARANSEYKVPEELSRPEQWRPRDGVYANAGADFNDHCTKSGDVIVRLTEGSIASGGTTCKAAGMMNIGLAYISLNMICDQTSGDKTNSEAGGTEIMRLKKIDDNTFLLQKTQNGKFNDDGGAVSYCPEEVQRTYAARKAMK
jgi:hypothetical protein